MTEKMHTAPPRSSSPDLPLVMSLLLVLAIPLITGALLSWHSLGELDVWLHQKAGQDILSGEGLPSLNTYSYTEPGHSWTNHEWLFQILVAATGPGPDAIEAGINRWVILRLLLTLLLLVVLLTGDRPWRAPPLDLLWLAPGILLGVTLLWSRLLLRPELLSYLLMVLIVRLSEFNSSKPWSIRQLLSLHNREILAFGVTLVWAQLHGFSALAPFIWLLAGLLGYIPGSGFPRTSTTRLLTGTALLLAALLMTPNGWQGLVYPLKALGQFSAAKVDLHSTISELKPLLQTPDGFHLTLAAFKLSLVLGLIHIVLTWPRRNLLRAGLWLLAAAATLATQRSLGLYAITFVLLFTDARQWAAVKVKIPAKAAFVPAAVVLAATTWFWPAVINDDFYLKEGQSRRFGSGPTVARFPFQATDILSRKPDARVFANIDAASLTLSLGQAKVFIDGRTEAYSPETWLRYQKLRQAEGEALAILNQSRTTDVLLTLGGKSFHSLLSALLQSPQWKVRHADPAGILLVHQDQAGATNHPSLASFARLKSPESDLLLSITRQADQLAAEATLLFLAEEPELGEARLRKGLTLRPEHPLLNHNLANQLLQKGQVGPALNYFEAALATNPRLGGTALNAGVCFMRMKKFQSAEKMFAKACRLQPQNYQAWANRSLALQQLHQKQKAFDAMQEAARLNPSNTRLQQALQNLRP